MTRTRITRRGRLVATSLTVLLFVMLVASLGGGGGERTLVLDRSAGSKATVVDSFTGEATFYGPGIPADAVTASGAPFNPQGATAAHPTLPFGTMVRVSRPEMGLSVTVEINDRLPNAGPTRIDLTVGAATVLGMIDEGRVPVQIEVLG